MINVYIDEFTPCLRNATTGELVDTEVIKLNRKTFLAKYNIKNGWHVNWGELLRENEVYALVIKGSVDIQGLVALSPNKDYGCVYVTWMCVAPHNSKLFCEEPKYLGVGGSSICDCSTKIRRMRFWRNYYGFCG